jgi:hypothetical protein
VGGTGLGHAFRLFASGRLRLDRRGEIPDRLVLTDGAPDGPGVFLWAEVALLALEFGIEAEVWLDLLPWLLQAEEIYVQAYGGAPSGPIDAGELGRRHRIGVPPRPSAEVMAGLDPPELGGPRDLVRRRETTLRTLLRGIYDLGAVDRAKGSVEPDPRHRTPRSGPEDGDVR